MTQVYDPPIVCKSCAVWNEAQAPFHVFGNTWYVGVRGLSVLLVDTGDGLVLIDGALPQSAALINANIRSLGFQTEDVKLILVSHVHYDHVGGIAALQRMSGADILTSGKGQIPLLRGNLEKDDPQFDVSAGESRFPPVANVHVVRDRQTIELGETRIVAHYTPGHTPGGISYTWQSCDKVRCLDIVYADSLTPISADGYFFSDGQDPAAEQLVRSARRIAELDCDIFLSNHPFRFDMEARLARQDADRFVDADACRNYAVASLAQLEKRMLIEASQ
ncbi:MAG: subclass B3 metallo-beta-lactamase [Woeseiaceae bacterium]|nr:subclass B3 metallo-beta-lactamase [Woeseiaceae bacterium]